MCEVLLSHSPPSLILRLAAGRAPHDDVFLLRFRNVLRLQEVELDESVDDEESGSQDPPESNVRGSGLVIVSFPNLMQMMSSVMMMVIRTQVCRPSLSHSGSSSSWKVSLRPEVSVEG